MKKTIIFILTVIMAFFCACSNENFLLSEDNTISIIENPATNSSVTHGETHTNIVEITQADVGGGEIVQEKYRQCYYNISYQLTLLVDEDEYKTWQKEVCDRDRSEVTEMFAKSFVQHFNISREDFERANLELAKTLYSPGSEIMMDPKDYANQEMYEIYNTDIIYTFDDEIINEYYLSGEYPFIYASDFEQAVESGEYLPQTVWIDIDQMEAEINAKYGEPEVTETTTGLPEETEITE